MDKRALRDIQSYWDDYAEGKIPIRQLGEGRRPSGISSRSGLPPWFREGMRKDWRRQEIMDLANISWTSSRGHVDSYKQCLREILEECCREKFTRLEDLQRLVWRNQKRRYRLYSTRERACARIGHKEKRRKMGKKIEISEAMYSVLRDMTEMFRFFSLEDMVEWLLQEQAFKTLSDIWDRQKRDHDAGKLDEKTFQLATNYSLVLMKMLKGIEDRLNASRALGRGPIDPGGGAGPDPDCRRTRCCHRQTFLRLKGGP